jgi:hypothetical protein
MKLICDDCKNTFNEDDLEYVKGFICNIGGHSYYEEYGVCPYCNSENWRDFSARDEEEQEDDNNLEGETK